MSELQQDLITDILLRLPIKPICQFKCVSKAWRTLLSIPKFTRPHLDFHKDDPKQLTLTASSYYRLDPDYHIVTLSASETSSDGANWEVVAKKGEFPVRRNIFLAGSCDGLVLLVLPHKEHSKILFNPITKESAKVVDNRDRGLISSCTYGFGYDSSSDDYKIVCMSELADGNGSLVDVYSVKMKSWKRIANSGYVLKSRRCFPFPDGDYNDPASGVFLNGCLHWLGSATNPPKRRYEIVCFDLAGEEFVEVPPALDKGFEFIDEISVIDGCLAVVSLVPKNVFWDMIVWEMKKYGAGDSWTVIARTRGSYVDRGFIKIVCGLNEDEIVVAVGMNQVCAYNMKNAGWRGLDIAGLPRHFRTVLLFRGSLLSPN